MRASRYSACNQRLTPLHGWSARSGSMTHITTLLEGHHWLRASERIECKLFILAFGGLNGAAPWYLACELHRTADIESHQLLRSASSAALDIPLTRLSTIGDRAFLVAVARAWNRLPASIATAPSLAAFTRLLKTEPFRRSFPHQCLFIFFPLYLWPCLFLYRFYVTCFISSFELRIM